MALYLTIQIEVNKDVNKKFIISEVSDLQNQSQAALCVSQHFYVYTQILYWIFYLMMLW